MQNAWQLDVFSYMQKLLTSEEKTSSILQIAGSSIEVGTKIYCTRIDDTHDQVLKLANALNKVHIRDENQPNEDDDRSSDDDDENEKQVKQKNKKKGRKLIRNDGNKATIYPVDAPLNAAVNRLDMGTQEHSRTDLLEEGRFHKCYDFGLFTQHEARCHKWKDLGQEKPPEVAYIKNTLFTQPVPSDKIYKKILNVFSDEWNLDGENDLNSTGNYTQTVIAILYNSHQNFYRALDKIPILTQGNGFFPLQCQLTSSETINAQTVYFDGLKIIVQDAGT